jgi:hypothetical protein
MEKLGIGSQMLNLALGNGSIGFYWSLGKVTQTFILKRGVQSFLFYDERYYFLRFWLVIRQNKAQNKVQRTLPSHYCQKRAPLSIPGSVQRKIIFIT